MIGGGDVEWCSDSTSLKDHCSIGSNGCYGTLTMKVKSVKAGE